MQNFEKRRDRYDFFSQADNPRFNLSFDLELPDFRPYCKERGIPPFHFLLFCLLSSVQDVENFRYREHDGKIIKIDKFCGSYTVVNKDNNLNFTQFDMTSDLDQFIARSLAAKKEAEESVQMINTGNELSEREQKDAFHITCIPWLRLTSIEHPDFRGSPDIPSFAWGRFGSAQDGLMTVPFSVQAHHGFVDGFHVHQLAQAIAARVARIINA
ncbi:CatA-like O-acetyltransferase [Undibacterium terreum]|uniref:Chloramphenicol acetyltransferase n=1 Tax=Undibacterium terreum TaxID=1224302 RepID=A0A916UZW8_9BURK|nr:CatA-like O-acetyltransferase [Undibacterium terreum]GGC98027.1 chloramphenicol acetyltransferase [Undibacterium terreum]